MFVSVALVGDEDVSVALVEDEDDLGQAPQQVLYLGAETCQKD
jgi:hypothetical protein